MLKKKFLISLLFILLVTFSVGCSEDVNSQKDTTKTVDASTQNGHSLVIKATGLNGDAILGACFEIKKSGKVIDTITTDDTGTATSTLLEPGEYVFVMKSVPQGFVIDSTDYFFKINNSNLIADVEIEEVELENN